MRILEPGLLTTVQDLGRYGYGKDGVCPSGALDEYALRAANLLVGNPEPAAGLEITLEGPRIEFKDDALIAICGADLDARIADIELPSWRAIYVQEGSVLAFGRARWGCRAYLAVAGGVDVPEVMASRSTYLRTGIGGFQGRSLRTDDVLPRGPVPAGTLHAMSEAAENMGPLPFALTQRRLEAPEQLYRYETIRFVRGPQWNMMDGRDAAVFVTNRFTVSSKSDRMGYRLSGPSLQSVKGADQVSTAVLTGTVQVPPDGKPIVLLHDRQTAGGYPMVAQVITADLPTVAQLKPSDEIGFEEVSLDRAQKALAERSILLDGLREGEKRASSRP